MKNNELFIKEGLKRTSQNNFNQASAGYNAKWFKRGAIFGYKIAKEEKLKNMEDEIYDVVTDLLREDINKSKAIERLVFLSGVGVMYKEMEDKNIKIHSTKNDADMLFEFAKWILPDDGIDEDLIKADIEVFMFKYKEYAEQ